MAYLAMSTNTIKTKRPLAGARHSTSLMALSLSKGGSDAPLTTHYSPLTPNHRLLTRAALLLMAGLAACNTSPPGPEATQEVVSRVVIPPPAVGALRWNNDPTLAFSADGAHLAYLVFQEDGSRQIHVRDMAAGESRPVPGTEGGDTPFFSPVGSPDGLWLGFFADGSLKKVPLGGGAAVTLTPEAPNLRGASWGPNGAIVFNLTDSDVLFEVSAAGGAPRQLTQRSEGETSHRWPHFLPDGKAVVFTVAVEASPASNPDDSQIAALQLDTGERKVLVRGGIFGRYAPSGPSGGTGHLVYHRAGTIMAVPFDPSTLEVRGTPALVLEDVLGSPPDTLTGVAQFSFSSGGSLAYIPPEQLTGGKIRILIAPNWFEELRQASTGR
ncbi:MAG: TolB family protein [Terriglobia bacterium]